MSTRIQGMTGGLSTTVTNKTANILTRIQNSSLVQNYVMPRLRSLQHMYYQAHWTIKLFILSAALMGVIPLGCYVGFMGMVTIGCVIVAAIAFTIVEGGFAVFGSAFLLPALGVTFLLAGGIGLTFFVLWCCYRLTMLMVGFIWGPAPRREVEDKAQGWAAEAGQRFEGASGKSSG
ncbi:hypothetical protein BGX28_005891 [Mortierella sp. GBA30]|nr:hypothetical protein BGX28_005891 [Mortierella sp. GBA30]